MSHFTDFQQSLKRKQSRKREGGRGEGRIQMHGSVLSLCTRGQAATVSSPRQMFARRFYSDLWQYKSFRALSSSMRVLFWFSSTATRFSKHLTYSFFFLRHSRAASLCDIKKKTGVKMMNKLRKLWTLTTSHQTDHKGPHLFFISRTSLLRVTSSVPPAVPSAGDVAMTTPGVMVLVGAVRI